MSSTTSSSPALTATLAYKEQLQARGDLRSLHDALRTLFGTDRSCINCLQFDHASETCLLTLPKPQRPPAKIIVQGCPAWEADIPF